MTARLLQQRYCAALLQQPPRYNGITTVNPIAEDDMRQTSVRAATRHQRGMAPDRRRLLMLAASAGLALGAAACGGGGADPAPSTSASASHGNVSVRGAGSGGSSRSEQGSGTFSLAFAECMRAHGVPDFPDPTGQNGQLGPSSGIDPASPRFQSALTGPCESLAPPAWVSSGKVTR
jgi:hypothetical protein